MLLLHRRIQHNGNDMMSLEACSMICIFIFILNRGKSNLVHKISLLHSLFVSIINVTVYKLVAEKVIIMVTNLKQATQVINHNSIFSKCLFYMKTLDV